MYNQTLYLGCQQSISAQVCLFLLENGYCVSTDDGFKNRDMNDICSIGISYEIPIKQKKRFLDYFIPKPKREFIGIIWYKNALDCLKCNCSEQKWSLLLYRSEYGEMTQKLIDELKFNFDINIVLYVVEDDLLIDTI